MGAQRDSASPGEAEHHGGACALGHPIGATAPRLIVTLSCLRECRSAFVMRAAPECTAGDAAGDRASVHATA